MLILLGVGAVRSASIMSNDSGSWSLVDEVIVDEPIAWGIGTSQKSNFGCDIVSSLN